MLFSFSLLPYFTTRPASLPIPSSGPFIGLIPPHRPSQAFAHSLRLRSKLSLRDLADMFFERGFAFTHETVRVWEARFAPLIAEQLRTKRRGQAGTSWYVDETYVKVNGKWCYLYRAIDREGNVVDSLLSEKRDMAAAKRFFRQAVVVVGHVPEQVTTDGHTSYPRAIRETMGNNITHRTNKYLNNLVEQDHRGIKQQYYPMHGFRNFKSAARFC